MRLMTLTGFTVLLGIAVPSLGLILPISLSPTSDAASAPSPSSPPSPFPVATPSPLLVAAATEPQTFQFEPEALRHCRQDGVVWINTRLRVFSVAGQRWYGATKDGAFTCRLYAQMAGYRASD